MKQTADIRSSVFNESLLAASGACSSGGFQGLVLIVEKRGEKHDYYIQMSRHQNNTWTLRISYALIKTPVVRVMALTSYRVVVQPGDQGPFSGSFPGRVVLLSSISGQDGGDILLFAVTFWPDEHDHMVIPAYKAETKQCRLLIVVFPQGGQCSSGMLVCI